MKNEEGNRHGMLTVIQYYNSEGKGANWLCRCDCGNIVVVNGVKMRSGNTKSCGCFRDMSLEERKKVWEKLESESIVEQSR